MPPYHPLQAAAEAGEYDDMHALVVRTDFTDEAAWERVARELRKPLPGDEPASPYLISDPGYADATAERVLQDVRETLSSLVPPGWAGPCLPGAVFIADGTTMSEPGHPLLAVSTEEDDETPEEDGPEEDGEDFGRRFRLLPDAAVEISVNLGLGNMDFADFAGDGVYERMVTW
jgi:hypothetical protein